MQPARLVDRLARLLLVVPVAQHDRVAARADFTLLVDRHDPAFGVHQLDLDPGHGATDRFDAFLQRIIRQRQEIDRAQLRLAVGDEHVLHVHVGDHALHDVDRARRPGHDAGAQRREVEFLEVRMSERGDEHRRDAVQRGTAL